MGPKARMGVPRRKQPLLKAPCEEHGDRGVAMFVNTQRMHIAGSDLSLALLCETRGAIKNTENDL